jgi:outer membrane protein assembly factor BamB
VGHPVVSGDCVIVPTGQGTLCGLSAENGSIRWNIPLGTKPCNNPQEAFFGGMFGRSYREDKSRMGYARVLVAGGHLIAYDSQSIWLFKPRIPDWACDVGIAGH